MFQLDFNDFLGVVPRAAGIGHENCLIQAKDSNGNQVTDEEKRFEKRECKCREKHGDENINHALLCILRADLNHLLAVGYGCLLHTFQLDVGFDELDRTIGASGHSLC